MKMPTSIVGKFKNRSSGKREHGFTYVMVLVAIVLIGIFAGVANVATSRVVQADREQELMFRGMAYRSAIQRYYAVAGRYPRSLNELLKDPRFVHRPYLRTLYPDPIIDRHKEEGGKLENAGWQLVRAADGGIAGVASSSKLEPIKKTNFPPGFEKFEDAKSYAEWIFEYIPFPAAPSGAVLR
jgi:type II secretory pathway pseudopilin PulG